jgi:hypothetical protein
MSIRHWSVTLVAFALVCLGMALITAKPARADEAPACRYTLEVVSPQLKADPAVLEFVILDKPELVKAIAEALTLAGETVPDGVTRILIAEDRGEDGAVRVRYGLEVGGCLLPPVPYPLASPFPAVERLSGKTAFGVFA